MDFEIIIYTCNRAMQLDLLLRSMERFIVSYDPTKVWLFYVPSQQDDGYFELADKYRGLNMWQQNDFARDLKSLAKQIKSRYVLGLCDDYIFINPLDIDTEYLLEDNSSSRPYLLGDMDDLSYLLCNADDSPRKCVNLFMTPQMSFCFSQDREAEVGRVCESLDCFWWDWTTVKDKKSDWAYPHNVAGHIYRTDYFRQMLRWSRVMSWELSKKRGLNFVNWKGLNTLEKAMTRWRRESTPYMVGLFKQTLLHIAINTAQKEYMFNQVGKKADQSQDALAKLYLNGFQIKLEPFLNKNYNANGIKDVNFEFEKQT